MSCEKCPCPDECLGSRAYCRWAAAVPQDPIALANICAASRRRRQSPPVITMPSVTQRRSLDAPRPSASPAGGCGCGGGTGSQPAPSLLTQGMTAAAAAGRWIASGLRLSSDETQASRRAICEGCPEFDREHGRCKICRCFISMKVRLPAEACPLSKWLAETAVPSGQQP